MKKETLFIVPKNELIILMTASVLICIIIICFYIRTLVRRVLIILIVYDNRDVKAVKVICDYCESCEDF